jgi:hypothetical protein
MVQRVFQQRDLTGVEDCILASLEVNLIGNPVASFLKWSKKKGKKLA